MYLLRGFADHKRTPISLLVSTGIGWFLCFSPIIFSPLDIFIAQEPPEAESTLEEKVQ